MVNLGDLGEYDNYRLTASIIGVAIIIFIGVSILIAIFWRNDIDKNAYIIALTIGLPIVGVLAFVLGVFARGEVAMEQMKQM